MPVELKERLLLSLLACNAGNAVRAVHMDRDSLQEQGTMLSLRWHASFTCSGVHDKVPNSLEGQSAAPGQHKQSTCHAGQIQTGSSAWEIHLLSANRCFRTGWICSCPAERSSIYNKVRQSLWNIRSKHCLPSATLQSSRFMDVALTLQRFGR